MSSSNPQFALMGAQTGNCLRVSVALEVLGIPYEPIKIDLRAGEQNDAKFLAKNPFGRVPVLLARAGQEPSILTQSNAILLHLCSIRPGVLLPAHDDPMRAKILECFFYFVTEVIAVGAGSFRLTRSGNPDGAELLMERALDAIAESQRFLRPGPFMGGALFTLADIAALTVINAYSERVEWGKLPLLRSWFDAVISRNDVRRGLSAFSTS